MIAQLMEAAEAAERATDQGQSLQVLLRADGIVVRSRIETDYLGWSREFAISWDEFDIDPAKLPQMVRYEANLLTERRQQVPVIKVVPAGARPAVRLIEREDWPVFGMALATIAACLPMAAGLWP